MDLTIQANQKKPIGKLEFPDPSGKKTKILTTGELGIGKRLISLEVALTRLKV